jgi:hypothetical protein
MNDVLFPMLIIPWKERHDSIKFEAVKWPSENEVLFATTLSINGDSYRISIGRERNIKIYSNKEDLNIV